eukprot:205047-Hanusia_phi.AAC.3
MNSGSNQGRQPPPGARNFGAAQPPRNALPPTTSVDMTFGLRSESGNYPPIAPPPMEIPSVPPRDPRSNYPTAQRSRDPRVNISADRPLSSPVINSPRYDGRDKSLPAKSSGWTTQQSPSSVVSPSFLPCSQPSPLNSSNQSMLGARGIPSLPRPGDENRMQPLPRLTYDSNVEEFLNGPKRRKVGEKTFKRLCCSSDFHKLKSVLTVLKTANLSPYQENIMQMKYGLTRGDIDFEFDILLHLREKLANKSMAWEYNLAKAWQIIGKPLISLDVAVYPEDEITNTLVVANASEVIKGFVFLGAGGQKNEENDSENPIMVFEKSKQFRERKMTLQKWYDDNRIRYILNLAKDETGMEKMKYPFEYVEVEAQTTKPDLRSMRIEHDDDDDETIRVLRLPMRDHDDYDVENSWELFEAARFLERAWRRHKRFLMRSLTEEIQGNNRQDNSPSRPVMVMIHCFGGINRHISRRCLTKQNAVETVLKDKDVWMASVKSRIQKEIASEGEPGPWCKDVEKYLELKEHYAFRMSHGSLGIFAVDCGGLPGSPIYSDEEDQALITASDNQLRTLRSSH